jgi:hypothetical protein
MKSWQLWNLSKEVQYLQQLQNLRKWCQTSEIKFFFPEKEIVNDIPNLFGSLQKMKIPQVQSDIDFEVVNSYTTDLSGIDNIITVILS